MDNRDRMLLAQGTTTAGSPDSDYPGYTSMSVQLAVDETARRGGGVVQLDEGVYEIFGPIRLSSRVELIGAGPKTVLRKTDGFKSPFVIDADFGELRVEVADASGFRAGMGLQIFDESHKWGWDESTAIISSVEGNVLRIDRHLDRDYRADDGGMATNACSIIEAIGAEQVRVSDLTIDGNKAANESIGGCRAGGIYLHKASDCVVERVTVRDFHGDGISWQVTERISVLNCEILGSAGSGLHPGAGSLFSQVKDNVSSDNGTAGLYVCWRVQRGEFERNVLAGNAVSGISLGHKDSDNRFADNVIRGNGNCGVFFRAENEANGANRNKWHRNIIEDNEGCGIYVSGSSVDNVFEDNAIGDTGAGRQHTAIRYGDGTESR
ncbi:right-handed parallel beta-helix repeat-containing protein [Cohnella lupini]|uniref:Copper-binding protein NosD n=1 Tax=Cohnella lupini TaxID=1294267 RepID=A0A3D9HSY7_9BACL|nr:right-handed parallel beta-helix repeat-containing protein [Cohnella lupini]RED52613.1 copper-binding protein NosD [Cohnella lupini]